MPEGLVRAYRARALSPDRPFVRGTAQNPDVYFQARETVNPFYARTPDIVEDVMARLGDRTGRRYHVVDYSGHPEAERVLVLMGAARRPPGRRWPTLQPRQVAGLQNHEKRRSIGQVLPQIP